MSFVNKKEKSICVSVAPSRCVCDVVKEFMGRYKEDITQMQLQVERKRAYNNYIHTQKGKIDGGGSVEYPTWILCHTLQRHRHQINHQISAFLNPSSRFAMARQCKNVLPNSVHILKHTIFHALESLEAYDYFQQTRSSKSQAYLRT